MSSERPHRTVLVVDDSALMRTVISEVIGRFAQFTVIGTAVDGEDALTKVHALDPDIVTLDIEMPGLDGLAVLGYIMSESPRAVVMLSGADTEGQVSATLRALELGAVDFVHKPQAAGARQVTEIEERLHQALAAAAVVNLRGVSMLARPVFVPKRGAEARGGAHAALVIAASTGGPRALAEVIPMLPASLDAVVIVVQHMPRGFTAGLADRLDTLSVLEVSEVVDGELLRPGHVYIAPGGTHCTVVATHEGPRAALHDGAPVWGVKPAADPLFASAAAVFGAHCVGVVLTGRGRDGSAGLAAVRAAGGGAVVQDRDSSIIYGMPLAALETAGADRVAPLGAVAGAAVALLARHRPVEPRP